MKSTDGLLSPLILGCSGSLYMLSGGLLYAERYVYGFTALFLGICAMIYSVIVMREGN